MVTIDKTESKIESLVDKIKNIKFTFSDSSLEREAEEKKEEAILALEEYLDLATTDLENRQDSNNESDVEETS